MFGLCCCAVQAPTAEGFTDPAGLCSTYLDTFGSDAGSTFARFLAVVNFLTANGLYVVIDYQYQQASGTMSLVLASRCSGSSLKELRSCPWLPPVTAVSACCRPALPAGLVAWGVLHDGLQHLTAEMKIAVLLNADLQSGGR